MIKVIHGTVKNKGVYHETGALLELSEDEERRLVALKVAEKVTDEPELPEIAEPAADEPAAFTDPAKNPAADAEEAENAEVGTAVEMNSEDIAAAVVSAPNPEESHPAAKHASKSKKKA